VNTVTSLCHHAPSIHLRHVSAIEIRLADFFLAFNAFSVLTDVQTASMGLCFWLFYVLLIVMSDHLKMIMY